MSGSVVYSIYNSFFNNSSRASLSEICCDKHVTFTRTAARVYKHRNCFPKLTLSVIILSRKNRGWGLTMSDTPSHTRYTHRLSPGCVLDWDHETTCGQDGVLLLDFLQLCRSSGENASISLGEFHSFVSSKHATRSISCTSAADMPRDASPGTLVTPNTTSPPETNYQADFFPI